jgi:hypothetical protein
VFNVGNVAILWISGLSCIHSCCFFFQSANSTAIGFYSKYWQGVRLTSLLQEATTIRIPHVSHFFEEIQLDQKITISLSEQLRLFGQHLQKTLYPIPYQWYTHFHVCTFDKGFKMRTVRNVVQNEWQYLLSASFAVAQAIVWR